MSNIKLGVKLLLCGAVAGLVAGCNMNGGKANDSEVAGADSVAQSEAAAKGGFAVDSFKYEYKKNHTECVIKIDFPVSGDSVLLQNVRNYIAETVGVPFHNGFTTGQQMVNVLGGRVVDSMLVMRKELEGGLEEGAEGEIPDIYQMVNTRLAHATPTYVTYSSGREVYSGGAHGGFIVKDATFDRLSGKRIDNSVFVNTRSAGFKKLLKDGLKSYFAEASGEKGKKEMSDSELESYLFEGLGSLSLPQNPVTLTPSGISFVYQQYEIAAYAMGLPSFVVTYEAAAPYLSREAKRIAGLK